MPWNGSGVFMRIRNWVNEAASGIPIQPNEFDEQEQDFVVAGFGNCITRDGQGGPTADIPWNNFGITGLRAPALGGDVANKTYVDTATTARSMGGFKLTNVAAPTVGTDAANMAYVLATGFNLTLPSTVGKAGNSLQTDGVAGNVFWASSPGSSLYLNRTFGGF